jgi:hypothetical protein
LHRYAYGHSKPLDLRDPYGLEPEEKSWFEKMFESDSSKVAAEAVAQSADDMKGAAKALGKGVGAVNTAESVGEIGAGVTNVFSHLACQNATIAYASNPCSATEKAMKDACDQAEKVKKAYSNSYGK